MTEQKDSPPVTRGGWVPVGTGAKRREVHATRSRPRGRERRSSIVAAAQAVFEEQGYELARVEDIVDKAKVSRGTFYTYFESKLEVFREVTDYALANINEAVTAHPPEDVVGTAARLSWTNDLYLEVYAENAKIMGMLEQVALVDPYIHERRLKARQENVARTAGQIRRWQKQGRANPDLDPATAARLLTSMLSNFAHWSLYGGDDYDAEAAKTTVSEMWLGAIGFTDTPTEDGSSKPHRSMTAVAGKAPAASPKATKSAQKAPATRAVKATVQPRKRVSAAAKAGTT